MKKKLLLLLALVLMLACAALASCDMIDDVTSNVIAQRQAGTLGCANANLSADAAVDAVVAALLLLIQFFVTCGNEAKHFHPSPFIVS